MVNRITFFIIVLVAISSFVQCRSRFKIRGPCRKIIYHPPRGKQVHTYPPSKGMSGTGSSRGYGYSTRVPTYYTSPQYVYVNQYTQSNSRYSNLLTGLAMYNLGRLHSHRYHHYYHDHYHRRSNNATNSEYSTEETKEDAVCVMRITEHDIEDYLSIPCDIVNAFINGTTKPSETLGERVPTVCVDGSVLNSNYNDNSSCTLQAIDPLLKAGPPIDSQDIQCTVEIHTKTETISTVVDYETLMQYAKMPVPEYKESMVLPSRGTLKWMLEDLPWWLSLFIAV